MRGKKTKQITHLAREIQLRLIAEGKLRQPENMIELQQQLRSIQRTLKRRYKKLRTQGETGSLN